MWIAVSAPRVGEIPRDIARLAVRRDIISTSVSELRIEKREGRVERPRRAARFEEHMPLVDMALPRLAEYRAEVLHDQSPAEARRMRLLAGHLRHALAAAGISRRQFAERTGLAVELVVAIENGYGRPETAWRVLRLAHAGRPDNP